ncbi:MAG: N-acetylglucosamine-6-phosphate deacetylase [Oscillospiraceae bacterium]|nr:N-acetylglucosamine-6-phosphate deacetylase [Oscillospiraceae bacterium]
MVHKFYNGKVILGNTIAPEGTAVYTDGDRIVAVTREEKPFDVGHDAGGKYISPGFIDIHVHGGGGGDFMDCTVDAFLAAAELHAKFGTTVLLPTASSGVIEEYIGMFEVLDEANAKNTKGAYMPGIHLEGPYFALAQAGAQNPEYITPPKPEDYNLLLEKYGDKLARWSSAPELPGSKEFARACIDNNVVVAVGHSDADYDIVMEAYDWGYQLITHLYSGCSTVHRKNAYRISGVVEAAYMIDGMDVEIIADGCHLPASLLKYIVKFKGVDRISLITDALRGAGGADGGTFIAGSLKNGYEVVIENGVAKLMDGTAFAGSISTTNRLVRNMMQMADCTLLEAVRMMTANPARMANLKDRGAIREGNFADIVIFDDNIDVSLTMVNGNVVFEG